MILKILVLAFVGTGVGLVRFGIDRYRKARAFVESAVPAPGRIVGIEHAASSDASEDPDRFATIEFTAGNGRVARFR